MNFPVLFWHRHSERSEESTKNLLRALDSRSFAALRMTTRTWILICKNYIIIPIAFSAFLRHIVLASVAKQSTPRHCEVAPPLKQSIQIILDCHARRIGGHVEYSSQWHIVFISLQINQYPFASNHVIALFCGYLNEIIHIPLINSIG